MVRSKNTKVQPVSPFSIITVLLSNDTVQHAAHSKGYFEMHFSPVQNQTTLLSLAYKLILKTVAVKLINCNTFFPVKYRVFMHL